MPEPGAEKRVDLVFEGGGVKGLGLVGALSVLEERGYEPQSVAGSSAGALLAALLGAGYTAAELREIFLDFDFASVQDTSWEDRIPLIGTPLSLLKDQGIYEGKALLGHVRGLLKARGVHTFGDLVSHANAGEERHRYKAQVIASDITGRRLLILPRDASRLGVEKPDSFEVALAVRMSTSIPFYFEPVKFRNPATGRKHLIVDGGILSNFPVWIFDSRDEPRWPTFGLRLVEPEPRAFTGPPHAAHDPSAGRFRDHDRLRQEPRVHDAGGPRPALHRDSRLRPDYPDSYPGCTHDGLRSPEKTASGALRSRPRRCGAVFGDLEL